MNPLHFEIERHKPTNTRRRILLPMIALTALIPLWYLLFATSQTSQRRPHETAAVIVHRHEVGVNWFAVVGILALIVCLGLSASMARRPRF